MVATDREENKAGVSLYSMPNRIENIPLGYIHTYNSFELVNLIA